jgi:hypothetical protein
MTPPSDDVSLIPPQAWTRLSPMRRKRATRQVRETTPGIAAIVEQLRKLRLAAMLTRIRAELVVALLTVRTKVAVRVVKVSSRCIRLLRRGAQQEGSGRHGRNSCM